MINFDICGIIVCLFMVKKYRDHSTNLSYCAVLLGECKSQQNTGMRQRPHNTKLNAIQMRIICLFNIVICLLASPSSKPNQPAGIPDHKDNSFREFRKLCASLADEPSYLSKTALVSKYVSKGCDGGI